jgi:hypothetical protein
MASPFIVLVVDATGESAMSDTSKGSNSKSRTSSSTVFMETKLRRSVNAEANAGVPL